MSGPVIETDVKFINSEDLVTGKYRLDRPPFVIRSHGMTDPGRRSRNQDQFVIAQLDKVLRVYQTSYPQPAVQHGTDRAYLFIVADGVGGSVAGEQASALAIDSIEQFTLDTLKWFFQLRGGEEESLLTEFQQALGHADARLFAEANARPKLEGMATTATMAFVQEEKMFIAHAGDSRCYLLRERSLAPLTRDHTMVAEMVQAGYLKPEEAARHPFRNVLTNSLGGRTPGVHAEVHKLQLHPGDGLLLCTDGLTKAVPEAEIKALLEKEHDPRRACEELMALAKEHKADDNVTMIVVRFSGE